MQDVKSIRQYRRQIDKALGDGFLRQAMDRFAAAYRDNRPQVFARLDVDALVSEVAGLKDRAIADMAHLFEQFKDNAEKAGVHVHLARTAEDANRIIAGIARQNQVRAIIKSKSMTAEETLLNHHLEAEGLMVTETDLGEWIIQLRREGPSHMVMPAIHLSRRQVADLFTSVTGKVQDDDIQRLVKVARRELRQRFAQADMGITGANFAIADTGAVGLVTNEGNARLTTTLPRIQVALVGMDKLLPSIREALTILRILPRNATGQAITSYVTWITGTGEADANGQRQRHVVFLDNGRTALARDPVFSKVLRCVRCGACANVCPVYRMVGGHQYGHIYIGAIGLILTYFFHGREKARNLVQNCINCGACRDVCAAGIDLPGLIKAVYARILDEEGHPPHSSLLAAVLRNRTLFHGLLRSARAVQKPATDQTPYFRHLPLILDRRQAFRALPKLANKAFRQQWPRIRPRVSSARRTVALFAGCVQDFVYPEQLAAGVRLLADQKVAVTFPMSQSCCGLPAAMMGETKAARDVARQNIQALNADAVDQIVTLCASCASHLKNAYPRMFADDAAMRERARAFADKVVPFSVLAHDLLKDNACIFTAGGPVATYHAPCHLCRGLKVRDAPHALIPSAGYSFAPAAEEETCCGFGGTYSLKFADISREILDKKLADAVSTGAKVLITECPGCILQLRGGVEKRKLDLKVMHIAEALVEKLV